MQTQSSSNADEIYEVLERSIRSGKVAVGSVMPTEMELASQFGCGRHVVAQALNRLTHEGMVERKKRAGTRVIRDTPKSSRSTVELDAIAFIYPSDLHEGVRRILQGFQEVAHEAKRRVVMLSTGMDHKKEAEIVGRLSEFDVKGVVAYPVLPNLEDRLYFGQMLRSCSFPVVLVDTNLPGFGENSVIHDGFHAGWTMTNHLLGQGLKRVGFLSNYAWTTVMRETYLGYRQAMEAANVAIKPNYVLLDDFIEPDFEEPLSVGDGFVKKFLKNALEQELEAVVCGDDFLALICMKAARELGISVPKQLKVVGISDYAISSQSDPSLTTYRVPFEEIGRQSFHLLSRLLEDDPPTEKNIQIRGSLVTRQSG